MVNGLIEFMGISLRSSDIPSAASATLTAFLYLLTHCAQLVGRNLSRDNITSTRHGLWRYHRLDDVIAVKGFVEFNCVRSMIPDSR